MEAERVRSQLTRAEVCKRLGISMATYSRYINGKPIPSDVLLELAGMYKCSVDYLLQPGEGANENPRPF